MRSKTEKKRGPPDLPTAQTASKRLSQSQIKRRRKTAHALSLKNKVWKLTEELEKERQKKLHVTSLTDAKGNEGNAVKGEAHVEGEAMDDNSAVQESGDIPDERHSDNEVSTSIEDLGSPASEEESFHDCHSSVHGSPPPAVRSSEPPLPEIKHPDILAAAERVTTAMTLATTAEQRISRGKLKRIRKLEKRPWDLYSHDYNELSQTAKALDRLQSPGLFFKRENQVDGRRRSRQTFAAGIAIGDAELETDTFFVPKHASTEVVQATMMSEATSACGNG
ncbi:hypothetical protein CC80DRAFT_506764 [Byssothecium circinans]|uniref:Uncharacterized protein n=1 Tax=Byssothecium circinans TaxID=147558 RepID=A0A6A5TMG0_9PLEO|nr:hypothetical protein CC80DRAFT_506764 [Byssothecium circinans]